MILQEPHHFKILEFYFKKSIFMHKGNVKCYTYIVHAYGLIAFACLIVLCALFKLKHCILRFSTNGSQNDIYGQNFKKNSIKVFYWDSNNSSRKLKPALITAMLVKI